MRSLSGLIAVGAVMAILDKTATTRCTARISAYPDLTSPSRGKNRRARRHRVRQDLARSGGPPGDQRHLVVSLWQFTPPNAISAAWLMAVSPAPKAFAAASARFVTTCPANVRFLDQENFVYVAILGQPAIGHISSMSKYVIKWKLFHRS